LGNFNEEKFKALDRTLALARKYGIRVILVFIDPHENNTGGITDYCRAAGRIDPPDFFNDEWVKSHMKEYIRTLVNSVNGIAYKEDGAIFAWELVNDPWHTGSGKNFRRGAREMAGFVKSFDGNHLVYSGDDGSFWAEETEYYDEDKCPKNVESSHSFHMTGNIPQMTS